jgi:hypothetical protein
MSLEAVGAVDTLETMPSVIFRAISRASAQIDNPLRTPAFATVLAGQPMVRTVVLRGCDESKRFVWCFSDSRAAKVSALRENPNAAWCFYDPASRRQIRLAGPSTIECGTTMAEECWSTLSDVSRRNYSTDAAPGIALETPWEIRWVEHGYGHFAVIVTEVRSIDFLQLEAETSRRAKAVWEGSAWVTRWVAP